MILELESPVRVYEYDRVSGGELREIIKSLLPDDPSPRISIILDSTPIPERGRITDELSRLYTIRRFDQVQPNPQTRDIMGMFRDPGFSGTSLVLGIGGGSVLDSAKALAMLAANGGDLEEYLGAGAVRKIEKPSIPLILIPTTAGTGSEVTRVGVYTMPGGRKYTLSSPLMMAKAAVLSASFLGTVPPGLSASTGLDALDHALESIWNKNAMPRTRAIAEKAAADVLTWLPRVYAHMSAIQKGEAPNPGDVLTANRMMLRASCLAGTAFSITGTAAGHALSFILSEDWHVPHGAACAFTLPDIFDLALGDGDTMASLARISGRFHPDTKDTRELVSRLRSMIVTMMKTMQIPGTFAELGVSLTPDQIDEHFSRSFDDPKMLNQVPPASKETIYPLLERKC